MSDKRILFFDPDPGHHAGVIHHLLKMGLAPVVCDTTDLIRECQQREQHIELAVIGAPRPNGMISEAVRVLRRIDPDMVMICATDAEKVADEDAAELGVEEFIQRPYYLPQLEGAVRMGLELRRLREEAHRLRQILEKRQTFHGLIGGSAPMITLYRHLEQVAASQAPVLIHSEPGTEIQECVMAIHRCSDRRSAMIKRFDARYLEAEDLALFIRQATIDAPGILWIDNIERLNSQNQDVLLNLLCGEGSPGGWRLVTSSDHDLSASVESRLFRRDLFSRISVFTVKIPPLRERIEDLPLLAADRLRSRSRLGARSKRLTYRALLAASAYEWPRNVAEFDAALRYASERTRGDLIDAEAFPNEVRIRAKNSSIVSAECSFRDAKSQFEIEYYRDLLTRTHGNMSLASKISKVGRPYLYKKIRECNLDPESFRAQ